MITMPDRDDHDAAISVITMRGMCTQDLVHPLRGDVRKLLEQRRHTQPVGVDLARPRRARRLLCKRRMRALALRAVQADEDLDGVAADSERPRDRSLRCALRMQQHYLVE